MANCEYNIYFNIFLVFSNIAWEVVGEDDKAIKVKESMSIACKNVHALNYDHVFNMEVIYENSDEYACYVLTNEQSFKDASQICQTLTSPVKSELELLYLEG